MDPRSVETKHKATPPNTTIGNWYPDKNFPRLATMPEHL